MTGRFIRSFLGLTAIFPWQWHAKRQTYEPSNDEYPMLATRYDNENAAIEEASGMSEYQHQDAQGKGHKAWIRRHRKRFSGWRFATLNFATWATIVFSINLGITISVSSDLKTGRDVLSEGDCGRIKLLNSGFHALINVLSTILLSGSNYCMQCLCAPTRREIDIAHAKHHTLDIGVPSFRNLASISRRRLILWCLLGLSSIPLHLLYNSAIYASLSSNNYRVFMVSDAFLDDTQCQNCTGIPNTVEYTLKMLWDKAHMDALDELEPAECLQQYATAIQTDRRNLLLVASNAHFNQSERYSFYGDYQTNITNTNVYWTRLFSAADAKKYASSVDSYDWICSAMPGAMDDKSPGPAWSGTREGCSTKVETLQSNPTTWHVGDGGFAWPVEYCLSEKAIPRCKLHFSPTIAIVVTILNFIKAVLMFYTVFSITEEPLMTMGDAVASFLENEDTSTESLSLLNIKDIRSGRKPGVTVWEDPQFRWRDTTSSVRSIINISLLVIALIVVFVLLVVAVTKSGLDTAAVMRLGFGAVDARTVISSESSKFTTDTITLTLLANFPQVILSLIYFSYNASFTAMLMGLEWMAYARSSKGLRVSRRALRDQRSTYFLQLPYRFGIPLVILSGALHWLVSQSIFLVAIDLYDEYGSPGSTNTQFSVSGILDFKTCGFSPVAMLVVVIIGCLMVVANIGFGYIPYQRGMPLAGSSSTAISAACHSREEYRSEDGVISERKLQWGVVSTSVGSVGHCAFSSGNVGTLVKGRKYA